MRVIRVLVVDDAPEVRQALRELLPLAAVGRDLALEIVGEAGDGPEAVAQTAALDPDVVLMDLEMPEINGCAATRIIKARCPATRVVMLTVHSDQAARRQAQEAGVDEFVEKGVPMDALMAAISGDVHTAKGEIP